MTGPERQVTRPLLSVIVPAHNEACYIGDCIAALLASERTSYEAEIIVVANACSDRTVEIAVRHAAAAAARGWRFAVIDSPQPGKLAALNRGDAAARGGLRVYLDADVRVSPALLGQIATALDTAEPRYATGTPHVAAARTPLTRAYARFWQRLPFVAHGAPGFGLFAVNAAGRNRWGSFPDIISDDTFVRLSFAPEERLRLPAEYSWPMVEGFTNLVRVRRRQDDGVFEIGRRFPHLLVNDGTPGLGAAGLLRCALRDPAGFAAYAAVKLVVRTPFARSRQHWVRGR